MKSDKYFAYKSADKYFANQYKTNNFRLRTPSSFAMWTAADCGPMFGGGPDIGIKDKCNQGWNQSNSFSFEFNAQQMISPSCPNLNNYIIKDYEVFSVYCD